MARLLLLACCIVVTAAVAGAAESSPSESRQAGESSALIARARVRNGKKAGPRAAGATSRKPATAAPSESSDVGPQSGAEAKPTDAESPQVTSESTATASSTQSAKAPETASEPAPAPLRNEAAPSISGRLLVSVNEAGARVRLDGDLVGVSPLPHLEAARGTHSLSVEKDGFVRAAQEVQVVGGTETSVHIVLQPAHEEAASKAPTRRTLAYSAVAAGAVGSAAGATLYFLGNKKTADYQKAADAYTASSTKTNEQYEGVQRLDRERRAYDRLGLAALGVGLAGFATGIVLAVTGEDPKPNPSQPAGSPTPQSAPARALALLPFLSGAMVAGWF